MKKVLVVFAVFCVLVMSASSGWSQQPETIYMTSLEWPPYTGAELPNLGASIQIARQAFDAVGYNLSIKFYPWKRTVRTARNDHNFIGFLPEYYSLEKEKDFICSKPIGTSPLGFISIAEDKFVWEDLKDLKGKVIGVVLGYVNTAEFDQMVADGVLSVDYSRDDVTNIRKLLRGRIDLAVIDKNVFEYLMNVYPEFSRDDDRVVFNKKLLEVKELYACFRRGAEGKALCSKFNEGLKKIDINIFQKKYINNSLGK